MPKFMYSRDVDVLIVEFSDEKVDYAEEHGPFILHYSPAGELVLLEILDAREFLLNSLKAVMEKSESDLVTAGR